MNWQLLIRETGRKKFWKKNSVKITPDRSSQIMIYTTASWNINTNTREIKIFLQGRHLESKFAVLVQKNKKRHKMFTVAEQS